jgi:hypothetical protein
MPKDPREYIGADAITNVQRRSHDVRLATPWSSPDKLRDFLKARHHITLRALEIELGLAVMAGLPEKEVEKIKSAFQALNDLNISNIRKTDRGAR